MLNKHDKNLTLLICLVCAWLCLWLAGIIRPIAWMLDNWLFLVFCAAAVVAPICAFRFLGW